MIIKDISQHNLDDIIENCLKILKNGGIIITPTDTIYGIICDAGNTQAVEKIYQIKRRQYNKPLTIFSNCHQNIEKIALINPQEKNIIDNLMPGALSLIMNLKENHLISPNVNQNDRTISVRIPNNQFLLKILDQIPFLASTSVNISGQNNLTNIDQITQQFNQKVDLVINCGTIDNKASTIVKIIDGDIKILREGAILQQQITKIL